MNLAITDANLALMHFNNAEWGATGLHVYSIDCIKSSKCTLTTMADKNHSKNKAKHNKGVTMCYGIYCESSNEVRKIIGLYHHVIQHWLWQITASGMSIHCVGFKYSSSTGLVSPDIVITSYDVHDNVVSWKRFSHYFGSRGIIHRCIPLEWLINAVYFHCC